MKMENITHNHLRQILEDNYEFFKGDGEISDEDFVMLLQELFYSLLISPTIKKDGQVFPVWVGDERGNQFLPLFTDLAEYEKEFAGFEFNPGVSDFDSYLGAGIENIVINPSCEQIVFPTRAFADKPKTRSFRPDFTQDTLDLPGLKALLDCESSMDLGDAYDYDALFRNLADSVMFTSIGIKDESKNEDGVIRVKMAPLKTSPGGYLKLFTDKDEIRKEGDCYASVVNLEEFMEYLIRMDLNGFIINPKSEAVVVDRRVLMSYFDEFKKTYNSARYAGASEYAFVIEEDSM